jgi:hypothetical protein
VPAAAIEYIEGSTAMKAIGGMFVNLAALMMAGICAPAQAAPDACSLLTQARLNSVVGATMGQGQQIVANDEKSCAWAEPNASALKMRKVEISIVTPDFFEMEKTPLKDVTKTVVPGLGDDAYFVTSDVQGTILNVKKGATAISVDVRGHGFPIDQIKAMEKTLAQDALAKL